LKDEVVASKAEVIERSVGRVRDTYGGREAVFLTDYDVQDICVLNLQRACEAAIDMANRVIRLRRLRYPKDSKDSFDILVSAGFLDPAVGATMGRMVGFRNVAVHDYRKLDLIKVREIIEHRLDDLLAFSGTMVQADYPPP
jgi:uncharacterized protein YutE (UPF0331/DUF86 family)